MRILFLLTARGGSKRIVGKNLRTLKGLSLVGFKIIAAKQSRYCSRIIVSTDSPEIQAEARKYGADIPFNRPVELATDAASSFDVISHAMKWIEQQTNERYDAIMLLEPSSPFARASDYDAAVELMLSKEANVVVGLREVEVNSVFVGSLDEEGRIKHIVHKMQKTGKRHFRGQDYSPEYTMNGALYLFKWDYFMKHGTIYADPEKSFGYIMDRFHSIEIDEAIDLSWAEFLLEKGLVNFSQWKVELNHDRL